MIKYINISLQLYNMEFPNSHYKFDKSNFKRFFAIQNDIIQSYNSNPRNVLEDIKKPSKVYICGMGGSAIASDMLKIYLKKELEIITIRNYHLPETINKNDLVIISSYSGNTEESINCYRTARRLGVQIIIHTSGGKLAETASQARLALIKLPTGYPPRSALASSFFLLLRLFEDLGLITKKQEEVDALVDYIQKNNFENISMNLSEKLVNKIPLIYASENYYPVAYRWKTQFNENAKIAAFSGSYPELNHNELEGFSQNKELFHVISLTFDDDFSRMKKRINNTKQALTTNGISVTELEIKGSSLNKIFSAVLLGDWVSYFLALRLEVDPYPVAVIEKFKRSLGPFI